VLDDQSDRAHLDVARLAAAANGRKTVTGLTEPAAGGHYQHGRAVSRDIEGQDRASRLYRIQGRRDHRQTS